ncbi:MAG: DUF4386 domain-containing protein [Candidatus Kariarchaeaceae archaeon]
MGYSTCDEHTYETIKLVGYLFFTSHLFVAGYSVYKSVYITQVLGILLIIASFSYIIAFYIDLVVTIPEALLLIFMLFMIIGEISLGLWLFIKANHLLVSLEIPANE